MYNDERPHEAIGQQTPATLYVPSDRAYPRKLPPLEYPSHFERRLVSRNGGLRWNLSWVNVSHTLGGEYVGLEEIDHDLGLSTSGRWSSSPRARTHNRG
jgi:hypothetical protein